MKNPYPKGSLRYEWRELGTQLHELWDAIIGALPLIGKRLTKRDD